MSVSSEIERIKTNIANAYTQLESKGATIPTDKNSNNLATTITSIPTGGGTSINGKIEQKIVSSGSVSKGDLVGSSETTIIHKLTNTNDIGYQNSGTQFNNESNLIDDDETNYAELRTRSSGYGRGYFRLPSYESLGIPKATRILGYSATFSYTCGATMSYLSVSNVVFSNFSKTNPTTSSSTESKSLDMSYTTHIVDSTYKIINTQAVDMQNYGITIVLNYSSSSTSIKLHYIKWNITYLDRGKIKTITTSLDEILGVADSNGVEGDTIDVYVPNVE